MLLLESRDWFDVRILKPVGISRLDYGTVREFSSALASRIDGIHWVVMDLSGVAFLDSAALGTLVRVQFQLQQRQGGLRLAGVSENVRALLRINGLETGFRVYAEVDEALESFLGRQP